MWKNTLTQPSQIFFTQESSYLSFCYPPSNNHSLSLLVWSLHLPLPLLLPAMHSVILLLSCLPLPPIPSHSCHYSSLFVISLNASPIMGYPSPYLHWYIQFAFLLRISFFLVTSKWQYLYSILSMLELAQLLNWRKYSSLPCTYNMLAIGSLYSSQTKKKLPEYSLVIEIAIFMNLSKPTFGRLQASEIQKCYSL